jgi:hypothetical protein
MQFQLYKTRIFTNYNQIKRLIGTSKAFFNTIENLLTDYSEIKIVEITPLHELNLESATIHYQLSLDSIVYELKVVWTQSTPSTTSCFDVFIQVYPPDSNFSESHLFTDFLEALRIKFNGNWRIQDHELNQSILK